MRREIAILALYSRVVAWLRHGFATAQAGVSDPGYSH
jgi:hypothetical protein